MYGCQARSLPAGSLPPRPQLLLASARTLARATFAGVLALAPAAAGAQERPPDPTLGSGVERPFEVARPWTLPRGAVRLEAAGGLGFERRLPLSGLSGDLLQLRAGVAVGLADGVEARLEGVGWQRLEITAADSTAPQAELLELDGDGATSDALDATLAIRVRLAAAGGLATGVQVGVTLPNAGNESGLGRDETDVAASLIAAWRHAGLSLVGEAGVAILGNPTAEAAQNDQAVVGLLGELALASDAVLGAEVRSGFGDAATGNEILTRVAAGGRMRVGAVWLDASVRRIVGGAPDASGVEAGLTAVF